MKKHIKKFAIGISIVTIFLLVSWMVIFPNYEKIQPTGDYRVATSKYTWIDESRIETFNDKEEKRAVTIAVWYPDNVEDTYPLIVFSHGAFGHTNSNHSTYTDLASNGYIVVSIGHTYHALFNKDTDGNLTTVNRGFMKSVFEMNKLYDEKYAQVVYDTSREWMKLRVDDENFVLDTILDITRDDNGEAPFSMVDQSKIGLIGHSLGGASMAQLGRDRKDINCIINLDGTMLGEWTGVEDSKLQYNDIPYPIPLLNMYSQDIYTNAKSAEGEEYVNFHVTDEAECAYEVVMKNSGHMNLTDLPLFSPVLAKMLGVGTVDPRECIETSNKIILKFFNYYLKDGESLEFEKEY